MRPYYIVCPPYADCSAGIRVLHKLAENLKARDFEVELSWVNAPIDHQRWQKEGVVVYPDMAGNPLRFDRAAYYHLLPDIGKCKPLNEFSFNSSKIDGLWVNVIEPFFGPWPIAVNWPTACFWQGKGTIDPAVRATKSWTIINHSWPRPRAALAHLLQQSHTLYTTDHFTMLALEAALCGCDVVPIDSQGISVSNPPFNRDTLLASYQECRDHEEAQLDRFIHITQSDECLSKKDNCGENLPPTEDKLKWMPLRKFVPGPRQP